MIKFYIDTENLGHAVRKGIDKKQKSTKRKLDYETHKIMCPIASTCLIYIKHEMVFCRALRS